ncbi:Gfo/Idh/MocA family oxidoreductase [Dyella sp. A6]|uniref:Gfo/Idh/MocA family protein n=1 Tax=Dyella aluminiiresistens TaxID=3069105 RepID=UPI002E7A341E|nr:Gfo/Idh/MocA family oxidoreductase [Dyella sp. A6]
MSKPIRIAVVGMGKIAHDQHLPAIHADPGLELVATVSRRGESVGDLPHFNDITELAASGFEVDAVGLCTPPQVRWAIAQFAIEQGWHTFLEKPPGETLSEVIALQEAAKAQRVSLFASWHSRYAAGVEPAREWLSKRTIERVTITWREDVRVWHPGQTWIWEPGGFGVFDPGINALSIATRILPSPFFVQRCELDMPSNRDAPIAARVAFRDTSGAVIDMDLDFRQEGKQSWDIVVRTDSGILTLSEGGSVLHVDGTTDSPRGLDLAGEYPGLYRRFADIIREGISDVDLRPLRLVADAFLCARRIEVEPFVE